MAIQAAFAKELAGRHDCDDRFLAMRRYCELELAFLNVEYRVRDVALGVHFLVLPEIPYGSSRPRVGKEVQGVEWFIGRLGHCSTFLR
jgi:hypothetical protein